MILQTLDLFVDNMVFIYLPIQINCPILNENVPRVMGQTLFEVNNNLNFKLARDQVVFL